MQKLSLLVFILIQLILSIYSFNTDQIHHVKIKSIVSNDIEKREFLPLKCPKNLIFVDFNTTLNSDTSSCLTLGQGYCCLPCPIMNFYYPSNQITAILSGITVVRLFSIFAGILVIVVYVLLPQKRIYPRNIILFLTIAMLLWQVVFVFTIGDEKYSTFCSNDFEMAQQSNVKCAFQSSIAVFASIACCFWAFFLVLNAHLQAVWSSEFVGKHPVIIHVISWGIPAIFSVAALASNSVAYNFGTVCSLKSNSLYYYLFIPTLCVVLPTCALHFLTTLSLMFKSNFIRRIFCFGSKNNGDVSLEESNRYRVIGIGFVQWRILLLTFGVVSSLSGYWTYQKIVVDKIMTLFKIGNSNDSANLDHLALFSRCDPSYVVSFKNNKEQCEKEYASFVPPLYLVVIFELLFSVAGFLSFLIVFVGTPTLKEFFTWIKEKKDKKSEEPILFKVEDIRLEKIRTNSLVTMREKSCKRNYDDFPFNITESNESILETATTKSEVW
ncbi:hypothetical protein HDU92_001736 [Lobulomyces angularis]|nr:hypothetical protein HDU92_001736 [Lobulomyces angularis]